MSTETKKSFFSEITTIPPILQSSYFPSLDGLRAIAIIMVIFAHLKLTSNNFYSIIFNGEAGVLIFFVLSGFLITTLCIKEKVTTKNISLTSFYIRRALRIFPVAYLYLLTIILLNLVFNLNIHYINIIGSALYLTDFTSFFRKHYFTWHTGHFWSLSVEEQFYLIVPFILKKQFQIYLGLILFIALALPLIIALQAIYLPLATPAFTALTHFLIKFQAIAIGCLFSVIIFKYPFTGYINDYAKAIINISFFSLIFFIRYDNFLSVKSVFSGLLISVLAGGIILINIVPSKNFIFRILNFKPLKTIGVLSYSLYIWQQVFTSGDQRLPGFMINFPTNLVCIIAVSCVSYYFYERFFLKLKTKFSKIKSKPVVIV